MLSVVHSIVSCEDIQTLLIVPFVSAVGWLLPLSVLLGLSLVFLQQSVLYALDVNHVINGP